jgi:hypothetical protein
VRPQRAIETVNQGLARGLLTEGSMSTTPATEPKRCACAACHQVWPETMMVRVDDHLLCHLCKERALGSTTRYRMQSSFDIERLRFWGIVMTVVAVLGFTSFRIWIRSAGRDLAGGLPTAEAWVEKEPWPAFHLASAIKFGPARPSCATHAFLIDTPKHGIVAATVAIPEPGAKGQMLAAPAEWQLTAPNGSAIPVGAILPAATDAPVHGVFLASSRMPANLPITPLKLRGEGYIANHRMKLVTPPRNGQPARVYPVIVRSTASSGDSQFLLREKNHVNGRARVLLMTGDGSASIFELLETTAPMDELLGAPIIDAFGHLAAIVTGPDRDDTAPPAKIRRVTAFGMAALEDALE